MVYVFLADGFEEVEAIFPIDLMRRAGLAVSIVGVGANKQQSKGAHDIIIQADTSLDYVNISDAQALVFPGGMPGASNLASNNKITLLIQEQLKKNGVVAAICASPARLLGAQGFLTDKQFTCYPSTESLVVGGHYMPDEDVVQDGNIITSKGVGTAHKFAYVLIEVLLGREKADQIYQECLIK